MSFSETSEVTTALLKAQNTLLDYTGHVRPISDAQRRNLIAAIQQLRSRLGWRSLDMSGRVLKKESS